MADPLLCVAELAAAVAVVGPCTPEFLYTWIRCGTSLRGSAWQAAVIGSRGGRRELLGDRVREELHMPELTPPVSHYTHAVRFGDLLFISGLVGLDADLKVVSHDVVEQTEKILQDMSLILGRYNADFSAVLRLTVYLTTSRTARR